MISKREKDEELCCTVARIIGPSSSAQQALDKLRELRGEGKTAWVESKDWSWLVYGVNNYKSTPVKASNTERE